VHNIPIRDLALSAFDAQFPLLTGFYQPAQFYQDIPGDDLGPLVSLWRKFRDGRETMEFLPLWLARLTLEAIPQNEPQVERAKLIE